LNAKDAKDAKAVTSNSVRWPARIAGRLARPDRIDPRTALDRFSSWIDPTPAARAALRRHRTELAGRTL